MNHPVENVVIVVGDNPPVSVLYSSRPAEVWEGWEEKVKETAATKYHVKPFPLGHLLLIVIPDLDDVGELIAGGRLLPGGLQHLLVPGVTMKDLQCRIYLYEKTLIKMRSLKKIL